MLGFFVGALSRSKDFFCHGGHGKTRKKDKKTTM